MTSPGRVSLPGTRLASHAPSVRLVLIHTVQPRPLVRSQEDRLPRVFPDSVRSWRIIDRCHVQHLSQRGRVGSFFPRFHFVPRTAPPGTREAPNLQDRKRVPKLVQGAPQITKLLRQQNLAGVLASTSPVRPPGSAQVGRLLSH